MKKSNLYEILLDEADFLILNKSSGLLVVPDRWDRAKETLRDMIQAKFGPEVWPVHRLDKDASGVLLFSKSKDSRTFLEKQFRKREVNKIYHIFVQGELEKDEGTITYCISEDRDRPGLVKVGGKHAKDATTHYEVLERFRGLTYVKVMPLTGRQHQIRLHFKALGNPVLCDSLYGSEDGYYLSDMKKHYKGKEDEPEKPLMGRLALHALQLTFLREDGTEVLAEAPLPKDFLVFLKYLRKFWTKR
jgi:23S rRNA pseudouridine1911/1915/1917 synthase